MVQLLQSGDCLTSEGVIQDDQGAREASPFTPDLAVRIREAHHAAVQFKASRLI